MSAAGLLDDLAGIVGGAHVLTDPAITAGYLTDWTGRWTGDALAVVRPGDTAEVAGVVRRCAGSGVAICPQGGNTGLVGGSVPPVGMSAIVLSTARLDWIDDVDVPGRAVGAGAGVPLARLERRVRAAGLAFGVDLAARDSATVGGMVATNAGGIHVVRYGSMRAQVLGIEAVLASGEVLRRWRPLRKDNAGYDLPGLLTGSEGTLAVITGVLLRLVPQLRRTASAIAAVDHPAAALRVLTAIEEAGLVVCAAELMIRRGMDLLAEHGHRRPFADPPPYLLLVTVEAAGADLAVALEAAGVADAVLEEGSAAQLWAVREAHTEIIARASTTPVVKLDVSVPLPALGDLIDAVDPLAAEFGARHIPFGHLADGNLHVNLLDVDPARADELTDRVLRAVAGLGGSISAEHGVGRAKVPWLDLSRSPTDLAAMRAVKSALDPRGTLNPGVLGMASVTPPGRGL
ncbi:FAD-binding oxidoreductase [Gordonia sp. PP30]|uniref:FAD-binding oxidoreductase n=1 Tax=Gordonia sp. PP30 TaxID=2935861 RepID=UPI001FFF3152|nr:FAD-binding oxidoreductase [Gordonia sp. PP30]UQE74324.1 FAD-binding oxidoreductase [Gordonia sp. PP30]